MKKLFALILSSAMLATTVASAYSEEAVSDNTESIEFDLESMATEALVSLQKAIRTELFNRKMSEEKNTLVFDQDGIKIYATDKWEVNWMDQIEVQLIVSNESDANIGIGVDAFYVNGWDANEFNCNFGQINAGKKMTAAAAFSLEDVMADSVEEIEDMSIQIYTYNPETYSTISQYEEFTFSLNLAEE